VERFVQRLIDMGPEEIQREGILPKGTIEEWQSSLSETVLVGLVDYPEDYNRFIKSRTYTRPLDKLKRGWQQASYIALYVKNGVTTKNGVFVYGKIKNVSVEKQQIIFTVDVWENLPHVIQPVHYGIANYILTTLDSLKETKELPELFMKSKEEVSLWRMLRRISDQIKTELDDYNVDHATSVKKFRVRDINIVLRKKDRVIVLANGHSKQLVPIEKLDKSPTAVFRLLVDML